MTAIYDYLFITLAPGRAPQAALAERVRGWATGGSGGEVLGLFAPQLGWADNEAALLVRSAKGDPADALGEGVAARIERTRLAPTVRPADADRPPAGGIYVHRWFEVEPSDVEAFVALSTEAWASFEARFAATIFGLYRDVADEGAAARLLLITRYADHGVWEASRIPGAEATRAFQRRRQLTLRTWGASTRLASS